MDNRHPVKQRLLGEEPPEATDSVRGPGILEPPEEGAFKFYSVMSADGAAIFWMIGGASWRLRRSSALARSPPSSRRNAQVSSERPRVVDDRNWQVFAFTFVLPLVRGR